MPGSGTQNHSESLVHSQTRELPMEIWQEIFRLASSIEDTDEFTTNAKSYGTTIWNRWDEENVVKAEMTQAILQIALQTRLNITRVCKAWYSMGIEILYAHIRIFSYLWDDLASQRLLQNPHLLSHTKRLTIVPPGYHQDTNVERDANVARIAHLCANLPQLRILDAPGDTLIFLHRSLPTNLAVMIARGRRNYSKSLAFSPVPQDPLHTPWCNIRVLKVDLHSLHVRYTWRLQPHMGHITFVAVEELYFNDGHVRYEGVSNTVLEYIYERWKFPKLHTLSIRCFRWAEWWRFLEAHAQTLKILSLTVCSYFPLPDDKEKIQFPELEALSIDDDNSVSSVIVAGKVTRVGWDGLVFDEEPEARMMPAEGDKPKYLRRLMSTFNQWRDFPAATTYTVAGWHEILDWLEQQPEVIERVAEREKRGVKVEFIRIHG